MKSLVIYASRSGNTHRIAEAIADGLRALGPVSVTLADDVTTSVPKETDLLVIGGPTEAHGMTPPMVDLLDRLEPGAVAGMTAAAFDTRLRWPLLLSGSAGARIAARLVKAGARVIAPEESFFVTRQPVLEDGELERAKAWGATIGAKIAAGARAEPVGSSAG